MKYIFRCFEIKYFSVPVLQNIDIGMSVLLFMTCNENTSVE